MKNSPDTVSFIIFAIHFIRSEIMKVHLHPNIDYRKCFVCFASSVSTVPSNIPPHSGNCLFIPSQFITTEPMGVTLQIHKLQSSLIILDALIQNMKIWMCSYHIQLLKVLPSKDLYLWWYLHKVFFSRPSDYSGYLF